MVSIPVWFDWEESPNVVIEKQVRSFNSSMVRLGEIQLFAIFSVKTLFQFQYGSIGRRASAAPGAKWLMFQFQYGSIGRDSFNFSIRFGGAFQFQYGSIGRESSRWLYCQIQVCFNSSMVRLGVLSYSVCRRFVSGFNSSMVRLGVFRFFYLLPRFPCFNSSMVRLGEPRRTA